MLLERIAEKVLKEGPDRVVLNGEGDAVNSFRARESFNTTPDIIFIRKDGWTCGAPKRLENVAFNLWKDQWVGYMRKGDTRATPITAYFRSQL